MLLAMASNPDYEPQLYVKGISKEKSREYEEINALFNRAISGGYAPGSTFKMLNLFICSIPALYPLS